MFLLSLKFTFTYILSSLFDSVYTSLNLCDLLMRVCVCMVWERRKRINMFVNIRTFPYKRTTLSFSSLICSLAFFRVRFSPPCSCALFSSYRASSMYSRHFFINRIKHRPLMMHTSYHIARHTQWNSRLLHNLSSSWKKNKQQLKEEDNWSERLWRQMCKTCIHTYKHIYIHVFFIYLFINYNNYSILLLCYEYEF